MPNQNLNPTYRIEEFGLVTGAGLDSETCLAAATSLMPVRNTLSFDELAKANQIFLDEENIQKQREQMPILNQLKQQGFHPRYLRMLVLAKCAWQNMFSLLDKQQIQHAPVFIGLPAEPVHAPKKETSLFLSWFHQATDEAFDLDKSLLFPYGRASGLMALQAGLQTLRRGKCESVWIGAVDSFSDESILREQFQRGQLATEQNDGSTPGEGAVFFRLSKSQQGEQNGLQVIAAEYETQTSVVNESDSASEIALGRLLQRLVNDESDEFIIENVFPPYIGRHQAALEWGVGSYGLYPHLAAEHQSFYPAMLTGDIGAADGLIKCLLAASLTKGHSVAVSQSDQLYRAAVLLNNQQQTPLID